MRLVAVELLTKLGQALFAFSFLCLLRFEVRATVSRIAVLWLAFRIPRS